MRVRIGVDVGGTFTDFLVTGRPDGPVAWKTPTTSPDPSQGIFVGIREMVDCGLIRPTSVEEITVGTTIALNAIISRAGVKTGLLTTAGFRDVLEIGRESRPKLYDLQQEKLPVLVPRRLRVEVDERMDWRGRILKPLDPNQARERLAWLRDQGVESVAICLLHSYANSSHEDQIKELAQREFPDLAVSISTDVLHHYREYERTLITVLNAYVKPVMQRYLNGFVRGVAEVSPRARVFIAHSGGGVMRPGVAGERAIHSALSGPAAGVRGAAHVCSRAGMADFITMDMGGTSCDVAIIQAGKPQMTRRAELGGHVLGLRTVDVGSISAGGGTLAWVDSGGFLRVGPDSLGSTPGPACYGRGGSDPTITDAHLILGHIDPGNLLGGSIRLDVAAARRAIEERVARPLRMGVELAAAGILMIADAAMVRAIEVVSIERGHDPRDFALVAFGGAAPMHATAVAGELGISRVVVPRQAGVLCALGMLCCDEEYEVTRTVLKATAGVDPAWLAMQLRTIEAQARRLVEAGRKAETASWTLDVRYRGQTYSLEVPLARLPTSVDDLEQLEAEFERRYRSAFGYSMNGNPTEIENVRVILSLPRRPPEIKAGANQTAARRTAAGRPWRAHFEGHGFVECSIYQGSELAFEEVVRGPAVINTTGSTTLVAPGEEARVDEYGNLVIDIGAKAAVG